MPTVEALQPVEGVEAGQEKKTERTRAAEEEQANLPPMQHKAWEAPKVRAMNEVLGVELHPEELLLKAVEAPWKEVSSEESSDGEVVVCAPLKPRGPAPKWMRGEARDQEGQTKQKQQQRRGSRQQGGAGG